MKTKTSFSVGPKQLSALAHLVSNMKYLFFFSACILILSNFFYNLHVTSLNTN